jgi:rfaE bifunctional protein kinase chain/domain/rfaE bifunctional protein nucleotidyltransferase chain/domain
MIADKIIILDKLAEICKNEKEKGKKIVNCHGCFDLLHPGHILHFKAAKKYGDILIVTVTPDKFVKKGPGRPIFNEQLRMESIASLAVVDYVALNKWDTAINSLKLLKPDFYVKGKEYSDRSGDITGNILLEEKAVNEGGGEIKFTDEITFSSSKLINKHFNPLSNEAKDYLKSLKEKYNADDIVKQIENLKDLKVLVIGDAILDEYVFCKAIGRPEKAAVVSTKYLYRELYAGGSLAVANHIAGFVDKVKLITVLGEKDSKESYIKKKLKNNIEFNCFFRKDAPTIVKKRYLEDWNKTKLFEVSEINDDFISIGLERKIIDSLEKNINYVDMVIIADFGHGLLSQKINEKIVNISPFTAVNAQTNSANFGFNLISKYKKIDFICIDEKELRLPYGKKSGQIEALLKRLSKDTGCKKINITLGSSGSLYYQNGKEYFTPVFSQDIVDTVGAGDTVLSITSLLARKNINPEIIPFVGNAAGALAIKVMGNKESLNPVELFKFIDYMMK